ncbi:MAG TPA: hypothetical protein PKH39_00425 [Woeseiaceae bacterium]|nr:hypothetical protein [Woeseiaceae bacterium]
MKLTNTKKVFRSAIAIFGLVVSSTTLAGGPLAVCNSGQPFAWPNGGSGVPFNPDQGSLGVLDNAMATQAVSDAFQAWGDVATATISYQNAGPLAVDVDVTNFGPYYSPAAPDGVSAIVFDDTGEIFDTLFGPGSGILGFAGPEWLNFASCEILEGVSFLNGPAIGTLEGLLDLMVHEFGHYSNLAHSVVNGQLFIGVGDSSGPGDSNTFGNPPFPDPADIIETMYPFLFSNIDQRARTPHADDIASLSRIYPTADYAAATGSINGTIYLGSSRVTGVNVIARNIDEPFVDAISSISSDQTDDFSQANPFTGIYSLGNLTPGAQYAVYVDEILAGGFSTPLSTPLPGEEEFWNGANESSNSLTDIATEFEAITASAGAPVNGIDILFNTPPPGLPLPISDDGNVQIPLPFEFCVAGQAYDSVFINGNGFLTLGAAATGSTFFENPADFLSGPPRVAAFWDDLNPEDGGSVIYEQTDRTFTVSWDSVPEFALGGANSATVTLRDNSSRCAPGGNDDDDDLENGFGSLGGGNHHGYFFGNDVKISHGEISSTDGLVGVSSGAFATSGFEEEVDLSSRSRDGRRPLSMYFDAAVYEQFTDSDVDVANGDVRFIGVGNRFRDRFEHNDSIDRAARVSLPFDSINTAWKFTSIAPSADDIDFYQFNEELEAGTTLVAEVLTGQIDSVMGLYRCETTTKSKSRWWWYKPKPRCDAATAELVAFDDDGGNNLLSRIVYEIPEDGTYALAITFCCDYDFDGVDPGQGAPFDGGRYVLDAFVIDGVLLELGDESFQEVALDFEFPFQGESYNSVFVNSNGYLTFGDGEVFNYIPSVAGLESGLPRIAPLWIDLDQSSGGMILATNDPGSLTVSFIGVPEYFFGGSNTFSVTLDSSGSVSMSFSGLTAPEGLTGVAAGGGAPGTAVDLSTSTTWPVGDSTYELFDFIASPFDLDGAALTFE